ncbi:hypothetical protein HQ520_09570 [bacterium]|nr:hypothetical protein [bacterium]
MSNPKKQIVAGQSSFLLETRTVQAFLTETAAMLAPVTFCRDRKPIQPYSVSPWAEETLADDTPTIIKALRGDFMCSTFGGNDELFQGKQLPVHGETANGKWALKDYRSDEQGTVLQLEIDMPIQGGKCVGRTALVEGHDVVYQRHDFSGIHGPINPGHHATVLFPDHPGSGHLSFSPFVLAHSFIEPTEDPAQGGYSWLKPDTAIDDLRAVECIDGSTTDVTLYPARRGFEDIAILCPDPKLDIAWSSVTFSEEGHVWFTLRNPKDFPSTLLWMSNAGRHYAPWNGRHFNIMGIEDMTGFFHFGLAASSRDNLLTRHGIPTAHRPDEGNLSLPYIQGVALVEPGFDRVASIDVEDDDTIVLIAESGVRAKAPCRAAFVNTGKLEGLID